MTAYSECLPEMKPIHPILHETLNSTLTLLILWERWMPVQKEWHLSDNIYAGINNKIKTRKNFQVKVLAWKPRSVAGNCEHLLSSSLQVNWGKVLIKWRAFNISSNVLQLASCSSTIHAEWFHTVSSSNTKTSSFSWLDSESQFVPETEAQRKSFTLHKFNIQGDTSKGSAPNTEQY